MKVFRTLILTIGIVAIVLLISGSEVSAQCAMCKAAAETTDEVSTDGLNAGILYLMAFPYILFGFIGYFWYRNSKKNRAKKEQIESRIKKHLPQFSAK